MSGPYRTIQYGPISYLFVLIAMVVGFFASFALFSPVVDAGFEAFEGILGDALGIFGL